MCDSVSILARGRLVASGAVADVLAGRSTGDVRVRVADLDAAAAVLTAAGFTLSPGAGELVVHGAAEPALITRALAEQGHVLSQLTPVDADLESAFLALTGGPQ